MVVEKLVIQGCALDSHWGFICAKIHWYLRKYAEMLLHFYSNDLPVLTGIQRQVTSR
jgi:hypothetical protein